MKQWILRRLEKYTTLKATIKYQFAKMTNIDAAKRRKIIFGLIGFALVNLAFSIFSLYTLTSFGLFVLGILLYIQSTLSDIRKKGLIIYLSAKHQKMLLQRSLFDVFCDMWFIPKISIYGKALATPFFMKIEPHEAINQLKEFSAPTRKAFLTKGIINILPDHVKGVLLPQNELLTEESDASSNEDNSSSNDGNNSLTKSNKKENSKQAGEIIFNDSSSNQSLKDQLSMGNPKRFSTKGASSTDDDNLVNHNFSLSKQIELRKTFPAFADVSPIKAHLDYNEPSSSIRLRNSVLHKDKVVSDKTNHPRSRPNVQKTFLHDSEGEVKTQVINSSKIMDKKESKNRVEVSETWDKLELFIRKHRETVMKNRFKKNEPEKKMELKGALKTIQSIASLMSREGIMNKLEDKKILKIFMLSTVVLLLQFSISKKVRYWCYNTIHILLYVTGVIFSTGSLTILSLKMRDKYKKWKQDRMDIIRELPEEIAEDDDKDSPVAGEIEMEPL